MELSHNYDHTRIWMAVLARKPEIEADENKRLTLNQNGE